MYRLLLFLLISFFSCKEETPRIIDLRPPESSIGINYVELGGVDSIETWMDLHNAYCNSQGEQERVFFRLSVGEDKLVDSAYVGDQILVSPYIECRHGCGGFKDNYIYMIFSIENDSLHFQGEHIPKWSLPSLLTWYYLLSDTYPIRDFKKPFNNYRIFVESKGRFPQKISNSIQTLKWVSLAYLEIKEQEPQLIPDLSIQMIQLPPPPPPPPPPRDSLKTWDGG